MPIRCGLWGHPFDPPLAAILPTTASPLVLHGLAREEVAEVVHPNVREMSEPDSRFVPCLNPAPTLLPVPEGHLPCRHRFRAYAQSVCSYVPIGIARGTQLYSRNLNPPPGDCLTPA